MLTPCTTKQHSFLKVKQAPRQLPISDSYQSLYSPMYMPCLVRESPCAAQANIYNGGKHPRNLLTSRSPQKYSTHQEPRLSQEQMMAKFNTNHMKCSNQSGDKPYVQNLMLNFNQQCETLKVSPLIKAPTPKPTTPIRSAQGIPFL